MKIAITSFIILVLISFMILGLIIKNYDMAIVSATLIAYDLCFLYLKKDNTKIRKDVKRN